MPAVSPPTAPGWKPVTPQQAQMRRVARFVHIRMQRQQQRTQQLGQLMAGAWVPWVCHPSPVSAWALQGGVYLQACGHMMMWHENALQPGWLLFLVCSLKRMWPMGVPGMQRQCASCTCKTLGWRSRMPGEGCWRGEAVGESAWCPQKL